MVSKADTERAERIAKEFARLPEHRGLATAIASLISDERERYAKIAASHRPWQFSRDRNAPGPHYESCEGCGSVIATAIRKEGQGNE